MPHIICIHYPAGGTGKSTATVNVAAYLASKFRVLVIDLDGGQSTTTNALIREPPSLTVYEVLRGQVCIAEAVAHASHAFPENLALLAGSPKLSSLETDTSIDRNYWLSDHLESVTGYDFLLIDTPPAAGALTLMALTAAIHVITPIATEPKSIEQLPAWGYLFEAVTRRLNTKLSWLGIIPSRHDSKTRLGEECLTELNSKFPDIVLPPVRSSVRWREAMAQGLPPWTTQSTDFLSITQQLLRRLNYDEKTISEIASIAEAVRKAP